MMYDLIIVGGGLVGGALAASLEQSSLKIALIDAKLPQNDDPRLFALNHSSCTFLENLNIWPALKKQAAAINSVHVSKRGSFGAVRLAAADVELNDLGYVIPAFHIESALNEKLLTLKNVTIYRPAKVTDLVPLESGHQVVVQFEESELILSARLLIGADGAESTVRRLLKIGTEIKDYQQTAIVTRTQLKRSHHQVAYERFNQEGAIAMLPLPNNEAATIWTIDNTKAADLLALSDAAFVALLQKEFGYRLGKMQSISKRHSFPLRMVLAKENMLKNVILLGNAAHALHPIAAQGFNLALYEVAALAAQLSEGNDFDHDLLREQIQKQMRISTNVSHRLAEVFQYSSLLMKSILSVGMVGMDKSLALRRTFIKRMLGASANMPPLLLNASES